MMISQVLISGVQSFAPGGVERVDMISAIIVIVKVVVMVMVIVIVIVITCNIIIAVAFELKCNI